MEKSKKMKKWIIIIVALLTILVIAFLVIKGIREDRAHKQLLEDTEKVKTDLQTETRLLLKEYNLEDVDITVKFEAFGVDEDDLNDFTYMFNDNYTIYVTSSNECPLSFEEITDITRELGCYEINWTFGKEEYNSRGYDVFSDGDEIYHNSLEEDVKAASEKTARENEKKIQDILSSKEDSSEKNTSNSKTCKSCGRSFDDSSNKKSIRKTGMCSNCYNNYKNAEEALEDFE